MSDSESIIDGRLELRPASVDELDALVSGHRAALEMALGATVPDPLEAPPETADVIGWFRDAIARDPGIRPWFFRWLIDRSERRLVGSIGFGGYPDQEGALLMGYSVYPGDEGQGYASEAAGAIVRWALAQPGVRRVRATIRPGHEASRRVAAKAGLRHIGELESDEEGVSELWEIVRPPE